MTDRVLVAKVGGSLFDLPDLGERLRSWLAGLGTADVILVPGGGASADVARDLDRLHRLGPEAAHWLALRALSVSSLLLQALLPGSRVVGSVPLPPGQAGPVVLDPFAFVTGDEGRPGSLPHSWDATSDAVAARAAVVAGADRLVLLKSVTIPEGLSWEEAGARGLVDRTFVEVIKQAPGLRVTALNFRS
jgi:aspartokinase-like uncharacterized kinase